MSCPNASSRSARQRWTLASPSWNGLPPTTSPWWATAAMTSRLWRGITKSCRSPSRASGWWRTPSRKRGSASALCRPAPVTRHWVPICWSSPSPTANPGFIVRPMWTTSASSVSTSTAKWLAKTASSASTPLPSTTPVRPRSPSSAIASSGSWPPPGSRRVPMPTRRCWTCWKPIRVTSWSRPVKRSCWPPVSACWRCRSVTCCACSCVATSTAVSSPAWSMSPRSVTTRRCESKPSRSCRNISAATKRWSSTSTSPKGCWRGPTT